MRAPIAVLVVGLLASAVAPAGAGPGARGAFLRSLLLPGWGQRAGGHRAAAAWFLGAEASLWGAYLGMERLADGREDNCASFAASRAGARPAGKDEAFFDDLGFYSSVQQHNQYAAYEDGPAPVLYPMTPEYFWEWDSDASRREYRDLRNSSRSADRQALYVGGLVAVNHLLAAVHAARGAAAGGQAVGTAVAPVPFVAAWEPDRGLARLAWVRRF